MTASEANRQRVFRLLLVEREQMREQITTADKESPAVKRGKPSMSETRQLWTSGPSDRIPFAVALVDMGIPLLPL